MSNGKPPTTSAVNSVPMTALIHHEVNGDEVLQLDFENTQAQPELSCQASIPMTAPTSQYTGEDSQAQQNLSHEHTSGFPLFSAAQGHLASGNYHIQNPMLWQRGIEFVLSLEHPCFSHIRKAPQDAASGHVISAHTAIMDCRMEGDESSWQISSEGIDRLLQLSYSLPLNGEVTPVQAWQRLRARPDFDKCDVESLKAFQAQLMPEVRCYGFGAVLDEDIFESLASSFFQSL